MIHFAFPGITAYIKAVNNQAKAKVKLVATKICKGIGTRIKSTIMKLGPTKK